MYPSSIKVIIKLRLDTTKSKDKCRMYGFGLTLLFVPENNMNESLFVLGNGGETLLTSNELL